MFSWFKKKKEEAPQIQAVPLKPINYPAQVILLWAKAVEGDKVIQLWLRENGYESLFHATNAIYLIQESRDWLMENGYAHLMAMITQRKDWCKHKSGCWPIRWNCYFTSVVR